MTRKTVVEAPPTGLKRFWFAQLIKVIETGDDLPADVAKKATRWQDCACGTQDPRIPRYTGKEADSNRDAWEGMPKDMKLAELGLVFNREVGDRNYPMALVTLLRIEERSGEILADLYKKALAKAKRPKTIRRLAKSRVRSI